MVKVKKRMVVERFTCQNCMKRTMIRIEDRDAGTYILKCEKCDAEIGPLPSMGVSNLIL